MRPKRWITHRYMTFYFKSVFLLYPKSEIAKFFCTQDNSSLKRRSYVPMSTPHAGSDISAWRGVDCFIAYKAFGDAEI